MEAEQRGRRHDILHAARLIAFYVHGVSEEEFLADPEKQDAVIRRIEIIGEATAHLTEQTRRALPELPFRRMRGMRNIVSHDYGNGHLRIIGQVAPVHAPELQAILERFLNQLKTSET